MPRTSPQALKLIREFERRSAPLTPKEWEKERRFSPTHLEVRKISKIDYQFLLKEYLKTLHEQDQAQVMLEVYRLSPYRNLDSVVIDYFKSRALKKNFPLHDYAPAIASMVKKIDCWMTGDMLANVTSTLYERDQEGFGKHVKGWVDSKKPWQQRMGLLSLYYYSRCRKHYPSAEITKALVFKHLKTDHYYVQKAVGWTLREFHNVYPREAHAFLDQYLLDLSAQAFSTATEKMAPKTKVPWKLRRARARKSDS